MKRYILIPIVAILFLAPKLSAQILPGGSLMAPGAPPAMIGVELGLGEHTQLGTFDCDCGARFSEGTGSGFLGGLLFDLPLDYEWTIGLALKFDFKNTSSSILLRDPVVVQYNNGQERDSFSSGLVSLQRDNAVKETFFTLAPFVRYELARGAPFVQIGPGISFLVSSHLLHKRTLTSGTVSIFDSSGNSLGTISGVTFPNGSKEQIVQDTAIYVAKTLRLSILATVGWNLSLSDNAVIAPMISYDYPITKVRDDILANGWKLASLYFSVGLKYKLGE